MYPSELQIGIKEFEKYHNQALDWYLRSFNFKWESDEWTICRLKYKIYRERAMRYAKKLWTN